MDAKKGDGKVERELIAGATTDNVLQTAYEITVKTGDVRGAGTNAGVFITLFGEKTDSGQRDLENSSSNFTRGKIDQFNLDTADLGELSKIRIGHDNKGFGADWFLDWVKVKSAKTGKEWTFHCSKWFSSEVDDAQLVRDLVSGDSTNGPKLIQYVVTVRTGDIRGAGTDAKVFINIFGSNGDTGRRTLDNSSHNFAKGRTDIFTVDAVDIGEIKKVEIGHDGTGFGAGWYLQDVSVKDSLNNKEYKFPAGRWLATDEEDGKIVIELVPGAEEISSGGHYQISVFTGDRRGAGTDANVFIELYGDKGRTGSRPLNNSQNNFERAQVDNFTIEGADIGKLTKIRIGHDGKGFGAGWFLAKVVVHSYNLGQKFYFICNRWLASDEDDKQIVREIPAQAEDGPAAAPLPSYQIQVVTGDRKGAGTDANVYITLIGENGDSGKRKLEGSGNLFERSQTDTFGFECVDLGDIKKIRIAHDNSGFGPDWFLDKVIVLKMIKNGTFYVENGFRKHKMIVK
eukprot:TRINITY_DN3151_c0_g1_i3.p1 TRINITY_DN3151_c0_g1~~TRINITY_DN3151_c0_g1_i3.p1  ORF type:complete len:513 (-),score=190.16 TRINITY_DN3151_c0_g1_i3:51-1589(-)